MPRLLSLPRALSVPMLLALQAVPPAWAATGTEASSAPAEAVQRCLGTRERDPLAAMELAGQLLRRTDLDPLERIKALSCQGVAATLAGDMQQAMAAAEGLQDALEGDTGLAPGDQLRALSQLGRILHEAGQIQRAVQTYERLIATGSAIGGDEATRMQASTFHNIGLIHADFLDSDDVAIGYYRQAIALLHSIDEGAAIPLHSLGIALQRQGKADQALAALREAAAAIDGDTWRLLQLRIDSAIAALDPALDAPARLARLAGIRQQQARLPDPIHEGVTLARMAVAEIHAAGPEQALAHAGASLELTRQSRTPTDIYASLDALAEVHAALGNTRQVLDYTTRKHDMKLASLRGQRLEMLGAIQAGNQDVSTQLELERLRHREQIRQLEEQRETTLRTAAIVLLLFLVLGMAGFVLLQRRRQAQLRILSERDSLTGLANRHAATAALEAMAAQEHPGEARNVLFLIDIDHFKQINDSFGHDAGDRVLAGVATRLRAACRPQDLVSRWGGEEFLVACPGLSPQEAGAVAERLRSAMRHRLPLPEGDREVTASLGLAPAPFFDAPAGHPSRRWNHALRMADRALYAAKQRRDAWVGYWGGRLTATNLDQAGIDPAANPQVLQMGPAPAPAGQAHP